MATVFPREREVDLSIRISSVLVIDYVFPREREVDLSTCDDPTPAGRRKSSLVRGKWI